MHNDKKTPCYGCGSSNCNLNTQCPRCYRSMHCSRSLCPDCEQELQEEYDFYDDDD